MSVSAFPLADADLCVKCALCLPHCPTYRLTLDEGDSPRGRIALMQALATRAIPATPGLQAHLDGCLGCRACEVVCPAEVPYGRLIDAGRALPGGQGRSARLARLIAAVLTRPKLRRMLARLLWLYQASGLQSLVRRGLGGRGRLGRMEFLLPRVAWPRPLRGRAVPEGKLGSVQLFVGCAAELGEAQVLRDATTLLTRLGYEVRVPANQACCGALHLHNGMPRRAGALARANATAFAGTDPVVGSVTGCTATLREYPDLLGQGGESIALRTRDICAFLDSARGWERLSFLPLAKTVVVHEPCTGRNVLRQHDASYALLRRIPDLRVQALPGNQVCCGAAGSYFLTEAGTADRLVQAKLDAIAAAQPDLIVSTNIGCVLHIAGGLRRAGREIPLVHPVSLLARQLESLPPGH